MNNIKPTPNFLIHLDRFISKDVEYTLGGHQLVYKIEEHLFREVGGEDGTIWLFIGFRKITDTTRWTTFDMFYHNLLERYFAIDRFLDNMQLYFVDYSVTQLSKDLFQFDRMKRYNNNGF
jgi:hypothetical protein